MPRRRAGQPRRSHGCGRVALIGAASLAAGSGLAQAAGPVTLSETGSTLIYPLFQSWQVAFATSHPDIRLTLAATGSGRGTSDAISGKADIGMSDAYLEDDVSSAHPDILDIPLVISAQTIDVNIPELRATTLKLSGPVLAGIYSGRISTWNDPRIASLNPGTSLPGHAIVPVRREDSSGDSFVFTQFLTFSTPSWERSVGYDTSPDWPRVAGMRTATGNEGMVSALAGTPYSIGYVGGSYEDAAAKAGLTIASLRNAAGRFVLPTEATVTEAADQLTPRTPPDERLTLAFAPGANAYPLINYEYAVVRDRAGGTTDAAERRLLLWCIDPEGGSAASILAPLHFIALPPAIHALSETQISKIR